MRRTIVALTTFSLALLATEARARTLHPKMLLAAQAVHASGNRGAATAAPVRPVSTPTAWVTAKDLANITMAGSVTDSCVNKGSAGGTFYTLQPSHRPLRLDDGLFGAGRPYFWFPGQADIKMFVGSHFASSYITQYDATIYIVMYASVLEWNDPANVPNNPTPIEFDNIGLCVRSGDGGRALAWHVPRFVVQYSHVEAPIASGDQTLRVVKVQHHDDTLSISVDGGAPTSVPSGSILQPVSGYPYIGFNAQSFNNGMFHGAICEWLVYNRELTPSEDKANMAYLRQEWGTP
jgi:hypothetical protein